MGHVVEKLEEVVDQEKKVKHSKLSGGRDLGGCGVLVCACQRGWRGRMCACVRA